MAYGGHSYQMEYQRQRERELYGRELRHRREMEARTAALARGLGAEGLGSIAAGAASQSHRGYMINREMAESLREALQGADVDSHRTISKKPRPDKRSFLDRLQQEVDDWLEPIHKVLEA
jgi:hypothetical protein